MILKEKLFCYYYSKFQNHKEAAIKAGYDKSKADVIGIKLLLRKEIREEIKKMIQMGNKKDLMEKAIIGLERLAFGSITDVVKLAFAEKLEDIKNIAEMDLYNISEIKRVKGGGFEIKFFDRIKALEKIGEMSQIIDETTGIEGLYEAIKEGAQAISKEIEEENERGREVDLE